MRAGEGEREIETQQETERGEIDQEQDVCGAVENIHVVTIVPALWHHPSQ
jgi:hypothetical protein